MLLILNILLPSIVSNLDDFVKDQRDYKKNSPTIIIKTLIKIIIEKLFKNFSTCDCN